jgi:hypothetical protein
MNPLETAVLPPFTQAGRMAARMREHDWSRSELGARATWPHSLNLALNICLDSHFPIAVWWGPRLVQFYNDAYQPILGTEKDITAFGGAAIDSWREIWPTIGPMVEQVIHQGQAVKGEDLPLHIHRDGVLGLAHFTFSYSPIRDETGAVVGMFTAAVETTGRVALERRQAFRLQFADALRLVTSADAALQAAGDALGELLAARYIGIGEMEHAAQEPVFQAIGRHDCPDERCEPDGKTLLRAMLAAQPVASTTWRPAWPPAAWRRSRIRRPARCWSSRLSRTTSRWRWWSASAPRTGGRTWKC